MRNLIVYSFFFGSLAVFSQNDLEKDIIDIESKVIEWRRDFHQNPELSNQEFKTAKKIAAHLKSLGLEVQTGVAITGVVGLLKGDLPGKVVALRADIDALPVTERNDLPFKSKVETEFLGTKTGVMHACGHDTHTAILMG
ncbi:M20/M25/M40 family metallo-hydrolase, partial [Psychroserpens sp.]|uniref:M20/M25/M40 family metallo-hydrolase n=1 Tax=Psychroserpens sp. TaxID=2020870 RepID=UPI0039E4900A